jgi:hypothetical protein
MKKTLGLIRRKQTLVGALYFTYSNMGLIAGSQLARNFGHLS